MSIKVGNFKNSLQGIMVKIKFVKMSLEQYEKNHNFSEKISFSDEAQFHLERYIRKKSWCMNNSFEVHASSKTYSIVRLFLHQDHGVFFVSKMLQVMPFQLVTRDIRTCSWCTHWRIWTSMYCSLSRTIS